MNPAQEPAVLNQSAALKVLATIALVGQNVLVTTANAVALAANN